MSSATPWWVLLCYWEPQPISKYVNINGKAGHIIRKIRNPALLIINSWYKLFWVLPFWKNRVWYPPLVWCPLGSYDKMKVFNHLCGVVPFWKKLVLYPTLARCTLCCLCMWHGWLRPSISWCRMPSAVTQEVTGEGLKVALPSLMLKEMIRTFLQWMYLV